MADETNSARETEREREGRGDAAYAEAEKNNGIY